MVENKFFSALSKLTSRSEKVVICLICKVVDRDFGDFVHTPVI